MSLFDRFRRNNVVLTNKEPNETYIVGQDDILNELHDPRSEDWSYFNPPKIKPTIKNRRKASQFPSVYGILNNLIMKTLSSMVISGDNQEAVDHIVEMDKTWNLKNLMYEGLWANFVDGEVFYEKVITKDNHARLRRLAFDGETNLIKKKYDEYGELESYKQLVIRKSALKKFKGTSFWEDYQEQDVKTIVFDKEEISNPILIEINGEGQSLVKNIIDIAYMIESMTRMMPSIVFKSANVMVATIGNTDRKETKIDEQTRERIADQLSDYHKKGVVLVPYGVSLDLVGSETLPKIENYIKSLKGILYEGLITPESLYSSESSNRSTAQVQLTDPSTGHVLFIQYAQEFLKAWIERDLINKELELNGFNEGDACISFLTYDPNLDTNYLEEATDDDGIGVEEKPVDESGLGKHPANKEGSTALTVTNQPYKEVMNSGKENTTN